METVLGILYLIFLLWAAAKLWKRTQDESAEEENDFDLLTVSEKFEVAKRTNDDLRGMEQLLTDIDTCNDDRQAVVQLQWLGEDGELHTHDLYIDGTNTATECLRKIAERETSDLRAALAYQCEVLAECTRHRKNRRQNDAQAIGEWLREQTV